MCVGGWMVKLEAAIIIIIIIEDMGGCRVSAPETNECSMVGPCGSRIQTDRGIITQMWLQGWNNAKAKRNKDTMTGFN